MKIITAQELKYKLLNKQQKNALKVFFTDAEKVFKKTFKEEGKSHHLLFMERKASISKEVYQDLLADLASYLKLLGYIAFINAEYNAISIQLP